MTNEEIRRTMEFIIKEQESFSENMELLREAQVKGESRVTRFEGAIVSLYNTVSKLSDTVGELSGSVGELSKAQARTDERLNSLINVIERYISNGRNGRRKE
jgi:predicted nuclease with TOPRIM domain